MLGAFGLYAGAIRLPLLYDDAPTIWRLVERTMLSNFTLPHTLAAVEYRPGATTLWLITRDLFGWFHGPLLHMWNVWAHALNTALVIALAARLGRAAGWRGPAFPLLSGALFASFPFSYQAVLWAGALYHPIAAAAGLTALLVYLRWRDNHTGIWLGVSGAALLIACISHEAGFVFGLYLFGIELLLARRSQERPRRTAVLICALTLTYPILYQLTLVTVWSEGNYFERNSDLEAIIYKLAYFAQGMIAWMLAVARPARDADLQQKVALACDLLIASLMLGMLVLRRVRAPDLGLLALGWWGVSIAPAVALLDASYTSDAPRLMYLPSVGIALFWSAVVTGTMQLSRKRWQRAVPVVLAAAFVLWCMPFILARIAETQRLTPALEAIDQDLRQSEPNETFLLINAPFVSLPAQQTFLFGREGMHLWEVDGPDGRSWGPVWKWAGSVSGIRRETLALRHAASIAAAVRDGYEEADKSFTTGAPFKYGVFGRAVDDARLQDAILAANYIYRFDYDSPGIRARRIGRIEPMGAPAARPLARLVADDAGATLEAAVADRCGELVHLHLIWSDVHDMRRPTGVFVHGYDARGLQTLIADADLIGGLVPLERISSGLRVFETREIHIPPDIEVHSLHLGTYFRDSLQRYRAFGSDGSEWPANEVVIPIADDWCAW